MISVILGPEEDWSEAAADYALRLYGVDPSTSFKDARDLVLRLMKVANEKGEEVPAELTNLLSDLTSKEEWHTESIADARGAIEQLQQMPLPPQLTATMVVQHFRNKREFSEDDEKILRHLESQLLNESNDSE
ncbi:MAG: hypothetical protein QOG23_3748 [Blastocatellia bacterium]|nr:hypothetical protein [Blastocatellia bacterium]